MSELLYSAVARIARHESGARSFATIGVVTEVHRSVMFGNDHAVSVQLRDSGVVVPRLPVAVGAVGFVATPAVDDLVVVVFADGDPHAGIVVGRLYHRDVQPPDHADGQVVLQLPPGSTNPAIDLLADPATPELTVHVGDSTAQITGKQVTITIGGAELVVDGNNPAAISVTAGDAKLTMGAGGEVTVEASAKLTLKAAEVVIEGSGRVAISGGIVEVN